MLEALNVALADYQKKWDQLVAGRTNQAFFKSLRPTSVAWKTTDLKDFDKSFQNLTKACDQIHIGWVNERWLASLHLKGTTLEQGITIIKLMQRRPGSKDPVGLDHLDFITPDLKVAEKVLAGEKSLKWGPESNNPHCSWLSIWFDGTEAKIREGSVIDVCIAELRDISKSISADS